MSLKDLIVSNMKEAMRAHDAGRLSVIRLLLAAIKQKEVDEQGVADDALIQSIVAKLIKQRNDSVQQYLNAGRQDLADKESAEISVLSSYLPEQMTEEEIEQVVGSVMAELGVTGLGAMGKVMGKVKPMVAGKADMSKVSAIIKAKLTA